MDGMSIAIYWSKMEGTIVDGKVGNGSQGGVGEVGSVPPSLPVQQ